MKWLSTDDYFATEEPEWIVENMLPRGWVGLLNAREGGGKSTMVIAMARAVTTGTPFLGQGTAQGRVAYLNLDGMPGYSFKTLCEEFSPDGNMKWVQKMRWFDGEVKLPADEQDIVKELNGYNLIIFDTLAQLAAHSGLSERDETEMTLMMKSIKRIANKTDAAILVLHHMAKSGIDPKDPKSKQQFRGNTAIPATVDVAFDLTGQMDGILYFDYSKSRHNKIQIYPIKIDTTGYRLPPHMAELGAPLGAKKGLIAMQQTKIDVVDTAFQICVINRAKLGEQKGENTWEIPITDIRNICCAGLKYIYRDFVREMRHQGFFTQARKGYYLATFSEELIRKIEGTDK